MRRWAAVLLAVGLAGCATTTTVREATAVDVVQNWAGYAYQHPGTFDATAEVITPTFTSCGASERSLMATWVGLDEWPTVEQTGISYGCSGGKEWWAAWEQMYPQPQQTVLTGLGAGQAVFLSVQQQWPGVYQVSVYDQATGASYVHSFAAPGAGNASAECVTEYQGRADAIPHVAPIRWLSCVADGSRNVVADQTEQFSLDVNGRVVSTNTPAGLGFVQAVG